VALASAEGIACIGRPEYYPDKSSRRRKPCSQRNLKVKGKRAFSRSPEGKLRGGLDSWPSHNMGCCGVEKAAWPEMRTFKEILLAVRQGPGVLGDAKVGRHHGGTIR